MDWKLSDDRPIWLQLSEQLARRIVEYRETSGPFESVEEIMEVSGIGEAKFADLEGRITVNGEDS